MAQYDFVYKCRRCGEMDKGPSTTNETLAITSLNEVVVDGITNHHIGIPVTLVSTHGCKDGGYGVTDLQGIEVKKD